VGKMTKQIDKFQAQEKEYVGEMVIGQSRPSIDMEPPVDQESDISHLTVEDLEGIVGQFIGSIEQVPPMHSAIKVDGKRAYKSARKGIDLKLKPRTIQIHQFELTSIQLPTVAFKVVCSKGTYIRSLVRDFGKALGVGAYMSALRRTRIGDFSIEDAKLIEEIS